MVSELNSGLSDPFSRQVISAMLLGNRERLSKNTKALFKTSGVMHVLAVSGLHVGIIYLIVSYLISFLNPIKYGLLRFIVCAAVIWIYALITGFSSSVIRASFMFTLFAFSGLIRRGRNTYNVIACSAFFILLFDPQRIYDLGFLLSYSETNLF